MTGEQWAEIVEWVADRFPHDQWHPQQAVAYFDDLAEFDDTDVWAGLLAMYENGLKYAPNGSQLVRAARTQARQSARDDLYRRELPEPTEPVMAESAYSMTRFGEALSWDDMIKRIHAESKPCNNKQCDLHYATT